MSKLSAHALLTQPRQHPVPPSAEATCGPDDHDLEVSGPVEQPLLFEELYALVRVLGLELCLLGDAVELVRSVHVRRRDVDEPPDPGLDGRVHHSPQHRWWLPAVAQTPRRRDGLGAEDDDLDATDGVAERLLVRVRVELDDRD